MEISTLDYGIILTVFVVVILIGVYVGKSSGTDSESYFLSGRKLPWWLLGFSMVATTFSTDTPNLVTDFVRKGGVSANWAWWVYLLTGLLTVFIYAQLWRRSGVATDMEFYELRYGGRPARFLRAFRSLYLGVVFNTMAMAGVTLAAIKIAQIMLGIPPLQTVIIGGFVTMLFSAIGGFKGVVYTDFFLFFLAMIGAIGACIYVVNLPEIGGLEKLFTDEVVQQKMDLLPDFTNQEQLITLLIIPLAVQWWSSWYPGAEPGGGGYIAQRMLAAKNEKHAIAATFFFNIMHYALRPWPWILVALASLIVFPDLQSIQQAFPTVTSDKLGHDLAYPAMLTLLPKGLLGVVIASLCAAYISTISTHLNWGASYIVNDFYKTHINSKATDSRLVWVGRLSTALLMILSGFFALQLNNATQLFQIIIMFGAGTGLIFILRWFWWRINAWSEIVAMLVSGMVSLIFWSYGDAWFGAELLLPTWSQYPLVVIITTISWLITIFLTPTEKQEILVRFYKKTSPGGPGWWPVVGKSKEAKTNWAVPNGLLAMVVGSILVYSCLFATGQWIYGHYTQAIALTVIVFVSAWWLKNIWSKMKSLI